ncbi:hypothetical protein CLAFUW4_03619 [Fulvia fulva]|uniref:uncharacterized protein n=1 Tax=Passalora fulva TaxID=5499 RepID=UPI002852744F|nr:uncharacterized protein CLAFUR5_20159 [Fulvia fulva]KAK4632290.1 hypothetical protein CLAFUR4_03607 [Fulvia fulva]KAK4632525.1 hypothetical protein CLAFUR0_03610 [Fulvia fulva]WMI38799.1 hypothetical protein CLAFUR5_20159 [Fulvia fulva]WPV11295.1 hypothetical protein CLAFUW4_03619 [Fulvia fulva]WPV26385.1 hypothetical protein CLAFUW7_03611 [Fulvia fulva]
MRTKPVIGVKPLDFLSRSPWQLPTKHNAITNFDAVQIAKDALETTVLLHPRLPSLITSFLAFKRDHGSEEEKKLCNTLTQHGLVARLIKKRALHFVQASE